jgi:DNA-binding Lrp family transcriptional regulator
MCLVDTLDKKMLAELQRDGRLTVTELAERVGLSLSPCHRRLRALEQSGAISGYRAHLEPVPRTRFRGARLRHDAGADHATVASFEEAVAEVPHVLMAQRLFGDPDYLLQVVATDLTAFQDIYDQRLSTLPGVQRLSSTLVMKSVVENGVLPL